MFSTAVVDDKAMVNDKTPLAGLKDKEVKEIENELEAVLTPENYAIDVNDP